MNIYVDETPKNCSDCPCMNDGYGGYDCNLYYEQNEKILGCDYYSEEKPKECPLQSLAEHDKELIKKIKLALRKQVCQMQGDEHFYPQNVVCWQDVVAILDQVEKY